MLSLPGSLVQEWRSVKNRPGDALEQVDLFHEVVERHVQRQAEEQGRPGEPEYAEHNPHHAHGSGRGARALFLRPAHDQPAEDGGPCAEQHSGRGQQACRAEAERGYLEAEPAVVGFRSGRGHRMSDEARCVCGCVVGLTAGLVGYEDFAGGGWRP